MVNFAIIGCNNDCKKSSIQRIFSCQRKTKDKKLLKERNMDVSHVRCTEEGLKRNLEVIILRTTTERYLV